MKKWSLLLYYNFSGLNNEFWNFIVNHVLENETEAELELSIIIFHSLLWIVDLSSTWFIKVTLFLHRNLGLQGE